jgi:hypothetical protein
MKRILLLSLLICLLFLSTVGCPFIKSTSRTDAALPREYIDPTYTLPTGGTTWEVHDGDNLQAALNGAAPGDVIVVEAGTTFTGPFTLPDKGAGTGWIYVISSALASLPAEGNRVAPSDAPHMPRLTSSANSVLVTASGAHHWRLVGIEITPAVGTRQYDMVSFGNDEASLAGYAHDITIDRCYLHGNMAEGTRRGLRPNGRRMAVVNSYFCDFADPDTDAQAICAWCGEVFLIRNNHLEATTECLHFGGAAPSVNQQVPSDIVVRGNHLYKPGSWFGHEPGQVKNHFECKNATRVLFEGNVCENVWYHAQFGFSILLTPRNEGFTWATVSDVTVRFNKLLAVSQGITLLGSDTIAGEHCSRIDIHDNVIECVDWSDGSEGLIFRPLLEVGNLAIRHNTAFCRANGYTALTYAESGKTPAGLVVRDNVLLRGVMGWWGYLNGNGWEGEAGLNLVYGSTWEFDHNAIVGINSTDYPDGNWGPVDIAAVGFADYSHGDYRLAGASPYRGAASDGLDLGAGIDAVELATQDAVNGQTAQ